jgi:hypothetical protein
MVATDVLRNFSYHVAHHVASERGEISAWDDPYRECDHLEEALMQDRQANDRSRGWGYWPYTEVDYFSPLGEYLTSYHRPGPQHDG